MDLPTKTIIDLLTYLMPGFITAAVFHNLTPAPRPIPFERIVLALIFTVIAQAIVFSLRELSFRVGTAGVAVGVWTDNVQVVWSVLIAALLGLLIAYLANTDRLHAWFRGLEITRQTSYSSEWYGALAQNCGYIVLHLAGQRRLYGWAEEWPSSCDQGHFVMRSTEWLLDDKNSMPTTGVEKILVKASEVEMVELLTVLPPEEE